MINHSFGHNLKCQCQLKASIDIRLLNALYNNSGYRSNMFCIENLGKRVSFVYARRVGRKKSDTNRHILSRLKNYCDKDDVLSFAGHSPYVFENFTTGYKNEIEKVHASFTKRTLNVSEYSSNKCMYGELARFPLSHNACGLGIKYWLQLYNGTINMSLNNCYRLNGQYMVKSTNCLWRILQDFENAS